ncbi:HAMP domain-containing sensor histidine kinase [Metabacillus bambusae]|uniref:histidine kinase n=1 Tax=Metabacillus bambusae TaxID=2795218 RepID=A0ABS3MW52_9BACI|nr:HAMP domain-containing sensor histidine kinase [Metabacillus bambusae]MBO1510247.1 HAMP domain-containing histidine kinase [Metabacillus bambusae]
MKLPSSLLTKYIILILCALLVWPLIPALYYFPTKFTHHKTLYDTKELEDKWKEEATNLNGATERMINQRLQAINKLYPSAELFWVNSSGETRFVQSRIPNIPEQWTYTEIVLFMENSHQDDSLKLISLIGNDPNQGFMAIQIPKTNLIQYSGPYKTDYLLSLVIILACTSLTLISLLFFLRIRKRLVQLQSAMTVTSDNEIPNEVIVQNEDEIGKLEHAFNKMITQLKASRNRERKEEILRRQLIANISHDLRTPLTIIRQHAYTIQKEPASEKAVLSIQVMITKLDDVGRLIENLLSYNLLMAGKVQMEIKSIDVVEEMRKAIAEWYSVFEEKDFEIDINLPDDSLIWKVDSIWLRSIFDNLFQNILRHAHVGKYVGVEIVERNGDTFLIIKDKGMGMDTKSPQKGAGIGLGIVAVVTGEMNLHWNVSSSSRGTCHLLGENLNKT